MHLHLQNISQFWYSLLFFPNNGNKGLIKFIHKSQALLSVVLLSKPDYTHQIEHRNLTEYSAVDQYFIIKDPK